jgi:uncharacterized protein YjbI with pentapeptide repeats
LWGWDLSDLALPAATLMRADLSHADLHGVNLRQRGWPMRS